ncbi:MAG: TIM barrel protein [Candidatus Omnitrophica bacterium]|nr:TIM barrel protein [Candidatus Omnitrophota bacterium]
MRDSMYNYMKVGIIHFMAYPQVLKGEGPVLETMKEILDDDYFTAIEVSWIKDDKVKEEARGLLKKSGKAIGFGGQPPLLVNKLSLNALEKQEREKAIQQSKTSIDDAYFLGADGTAVLSGKYEGDSNRKYQTDALIGSLEELCDYAGSKGDMPVILETFDRDIDKKSLIGPTREAVKVAEEVKKRYGNFGLMIDLSHLPLLKETPKESLNMAKDHLAHVHIGNCIMSDKNHPAYGDWHPMFGIKEGENGVDELVEFLKVLVDIGYLNKSKPEIVSFEVKPFGEQTSQEVIRNAKETLNAAWSKL